MHYNNLQTSLKRPIERPNNIMVTTTHNFTPFIPSDLSLQKLNLQDKVIKLTADSAKLAGIPLETREAISGHMAGIKGSASLIFRSISRYQDKCT